MANHSALETEQWVDDWKIYYNISSKINSLYQKSEEKKPNGHLLNIDYIDHNAINMKELC